MSQDKEERVAEVIAAHFRDDRPATATDCAKCWAKVVEIRAESD